MKILLKNTLRSMSKNIGQVIIIVLTLIIVTALILAALCISDLFYNINNAAESRLSSGTDLRVHNVSDKSSYFSLQEITVKPGQVPPAGDPRYTQEEFDENFSYVLPFYNFDSAFFTDELSKIVRIESISFTSSEEGEKDPINYLDIRPLKNQLKRVERKYCFKTALSYISMPEADLDYCVKGSEVRFKLNNENIHFKDGAIIELKYLDAENEWYDYEDYTVEKSGNDSFIVFTMPENNLYLTAAEYVEVTVDENIDNVINTNIAFIGQKFSQQYGIYYGDKINILIGTQVVEFRVGPVVANKGFFTITGRHSILIDHSIVYNNLNLSDVTFTTSDAYTAAYFKLKDISTYEENKDRLQAIFGDTQEVVDADRIEWVEKVTKENTRLFTVAICFLSLVMILIMVSSFTILTKDRVTIASIFKSSGATKTQITMILLIEALFYGLIGSCLGLIGGYVLLKFAVKIIAPTLTNLISYNFIRFFTAFLIGMFVSAFSALIPILRISRKTLKEIYSGETKKLRKTHPAFIIGDAVLFAVLTLLLRLLSFPETVVTFLVLIDAIFLISFIFIVMPYVLQGAGYLVSKISVASGLMTISAINAKRNPNLVGTAKLLCSAVAFMVAIMWLMDITIASLNPFQQVFKQDVAVDFVSEDDVDDLVSDFRERTDIEDAYAFSIVQTLYPKGDYTSDDKANFFAFAADTDTLTKLFTTDLKVTSGSLRDITGELNPDGTYNVLVSYELSERRDIEVGDIFQAYDGNGLDSQTPLDHKFKCVGIFEYSFDINRAVICHSDALTKDTGSSIIKNYTIGLIANGNIDQLVKTLREDYSEDNVLILEAKDFIYKGGFILGDIGALFDYLSYAIAFVTAIGILNSVIVAHYERKQELSIYRMSGLSTSQFYRLYIYEALISGGAASVLGLISAVLLNLVLPSAAVLIGRIFNVAVLPWSVVAVSAVALIGYSIIGLMVSLKFGKDYKHNKIGNQRML